MRLGEVLTQRLDPVRQTGTFNGWSPITVHLDGHISVRNREQAFAGQMHAAYPGDVVFSKIDARNGAVGVLSPEIEQAVVTPEFPVFTADGDRVSTRYLELALRAGGFIELLRRQATGTSGRKRVTPTMFRELAIPLPSLAEQQAMVAAHDAALAAAAADEAAAARIDVAAADAFATALGLSAPPPLPDRPMFVARFADLDRWSHDAVLRRATAPATTAPRWPEVRLGEVIADLENGWSPKCLDRPAEGDEWGVLKVSAASAGRYRAEQNKALPSSLAFRPRLEVKSGQVLITRASGVATLVGIAAYVHETRPGLMLCDKLFRVVPSEADMLDLPYLAEVLALSSVRNQVTGEFSTKSAMMKNISKSALLALRFPLPPLDTQRALVSALGAARAEAAARRAVAARTRDAARAAFDAAVYG